MEAPPNSNHAGCLLSDKLWKIALHHGSVPQIFHINKDSVSFLLKNPREDSADPKAAAYALALDAMSAADPTVDFSKYQYVNVVTPTTQNILHDGATGVQEFFDG